MQFHEFIDSKQRKARKHLSLVKKMLERANFNVVNKLESRDDPHLFVYNNKGNLSFDGVRIYEIGGGLAYRVQKEVDKQPYGQAWPLEIEAMFEDLLAEDMPDEKIGKEIIASVVNELKDFFERSYKAEKDLDSFKHIDPLDSVVRRSSSGSDYASQVYDTSKP